jgi:hypothetical protein
VIAAAVISFTANALGVGILVLEGYGERNRKLVWLGCTFWTIGAAALVIALVAA